MGKKRKWVLVYPPFRHGDSDRPHRRYLDPHEEDCPDCDFRRGQCRECVGTGLGGRGMVQISIRNHRCSIEADPDTPACQFCNGSGRCRICHGEGVIKPDTGSAPLDPEAMWPFE